MSATRGSRAFSNVQLESLRYQRSAIPAAGGVVAVNSDGGVGVTTNLSISTMSVTGHAALNTVNASSAVTNSLRVLGDATIGTLDTNNVVIRNGLTVTTLGVSGSATVGGAVTVGGRLTAPTVVCDGLAATTLILPPLIVQPYGTSAVLSTQIVAGTTSNVPLLDNYALDVSGSAQISAGLTVSVLNVLDTANLPTDVNIDNLQAQDVYGRHVLAGSELVKPNPYGLWVVDQAVFEDGVTMYGPVALADTIRGTTAQMDSIVVSGTVQAQGLGVTGVGSLGSLMVGGAAQTNTLGVTGLGSLGSLVVGGAAQAQTLGVTGQATFGSLYAAGGTVDVFYSPNATFDAVQIVDQMTFDPTAVIVFPTSYHTAILANQMVAGTTQLGELNLLYAMDVAGDMLVKGGVTVQGALVGSSATFSSSIASAGISGTTANFSGAVSTGALTATTGNFVGNLVSVGLAGTTANFSGAVSTGVLTATTGNFSSSISSAGISGTTANFSGAVSTGALTATTGNFSSSISSAGISGTTANFSGAVSTGVLTATTGNFGGNLVSVGLAGTTANFSGAVTANGFVVGTAGLSTTGLTATVGNFSGAVTANGFVVGTAGLSTTGLTATVGNFSGVVSMGPLSSSTANFSGGITAAAGITVSSGVIAANTIQSYSGTLSVQPTASNVTIASGGGVVTMGSLSSGNGIVANQFLSANNGAYVAGNYGIQIAGTSGLYTPNLGAGAAFGYNAQNIGSNNLEIVIGRNNVATGGGLNIFNTSGMTTNTANTKIFALDRTGNLNITGTLTSVGIAGTTANLSGAVSMGALTATTGNFSGNLVSVGLAGSTANFSGAVSTGAITGQRGYFTGGVTTNTIQTLDSLNTMYILEPAGGTLVYISPCIPFTSTWIPQSQAGDCVIAAGATAMTIGMWPGGPTTTQFGSMRLDSSGGLQLTGPLKQTTTSGAIGAPAYAWRIRSNDPGSTAGPNKYLTITQGYNDCWANPGSYGVSNGGYTAPINGLYSVSCYLRNTDGNSNFGAFFSSFIYDTDGQNGSSYSAQGLVTPNYNETANSSDAVSVQLWIPDSTSGGNRQTAYMTQLIKMDAGQTIYVSVRSSPINSCTIDYVIFYGHLVCAL